MVLKINLMDLIDETGGMYNAVELLKILLEKNIIRFRIGYSTGTCTNIDHREVDALYNLNKKEKEGIFINRSTLSYGYLKTRGRDYIQFDIHFEDLDMRENGNVLEDLIKEIKEKEKIRLKEKEELRIKMKDIDPFGEEDWTNEKLITKFSLYKNIKIFESTEDDYYTVLIKLEEIAKRIGHRGCKINIIDQKENEYIIFNYIKIQIGSCKFVFDAKKKIYDYDEETYLKYTLYREKVKIDFINLTMTWLEIYETERFLEYGTMYYAPDEKNFENIDDIISFLKLRYLQTLSDDKLCNVPTHWCGEPFKHPIGRRKFEWDENRSNITLEDPYGEESWEYDYPFDWED